MRGNLLALLIALLGLSLHLACLPENGLPPTVAILSPGDGDTLQPGTVPIVALAYDENPGLKVQFYEDTVLKLTLTSSTSDTWIWNWDCSAESLGSRHTIMVRGTEVHGWAFSPKINVYIAAGRWPKGNNPRITEGN